MYEKRDKRDKKDKKDNGNNTNCKTDNSNIDNNKKCGSQKDIRKRKILTFCIVLGIVLAIGVACLMSAYASGPGSSEDPVALKSYVDARINEVEARISGSSGQGSTTGQGGSSSGAGGTGGGADTSVLAQLDELSRRVSALANENAELRRLIGDGGVGVPGSSGSSGSSGSNVSTGTAGGSWSTGSGGDGENGVGSGVGSGYGGIAGGGDGGPFISAGSSFFDVYEISSGQRLLLGAGTEVVVRTGDASAIVGELGGVVNLITGVNYNAGEGVARNNLLLSSRNDGRGLRFNADSYVLIKGAFEIR